MNETRISLTPMPAEAMRRELRSRIAEARKKELRDLIGDLADIELLPGETISLQYDEPSASTGFPVGAARTVAEDSSTELHDPIHVGNRRALQRGLTALGRIRASESDALSVALMRAEWWLDNLSALLSIYELELRAPLVTTTDTEVVFEWWVGDRKLTNYFSSTSIDYVKVWGADVNDEMDDGALTLTVALDLWRWLLGKG